MSKASVLLAGLACAATVVYAGFRIFAQDATISQKPTLTDEQIREQLVGSWRIVSASFGGVPSELHKNSITIKHITPVHVIWIGYQPDDRKIFRSAGGSWKVVDGKYIETMRYGLDEKFKQNTFGKDFVFECQFEGDLWIQSGKLPNGAEMVETWQRIKADEDVAKRPIDINSVESK